MYYIRTIDRASSENKDNNNSRISYSYECIYEHKSSYIGMCMYMHILQVYICIYTHVYIYTYL
jgi:hypothetical protein